MRAWFPLFVVVRLRVRAYRVFVALTAGQSVRLFDMLVCFLIKNKLIQTFMCIHERIDFIMKTEHMTPETWTLCSLCLHRTLPTCLVMHIRDFVDPQLKIRVAKEATYTFHDVVVLPAKRKYKHAFETVVAPAKAHYETCKQRAYHDNHVSSTESENELQQAEDTYHTLYDRWVLPARDKYETHYNEYIRRLSCINAQCTHPNKTRRREEGLYGERYYECPDCHKEWW